MGKQGFFSHGVLFRGRAARGRDWGLLCLLGLGFGRLGFGFRVLGLEFRV